VLTSSGQSHTITDGGPSLHHDPPRARYPRGVTWFVSVQIIAPRATRCRRPHSARPSPAGSCPYRGAADSRLLADRVRAGWMITATARAAGVSRQTGSKWWHRAEIGCLADRTSAVYRQTRRHAAALVERLCARRRSQLRVGPHVLGWESGLARSSVYAILRREGLSRLDRLEPRPPVVRYERDRPGELVHLDTKMLGQIGPGGGHRIHGVDARDRHRGIGCVVPGVSETRERRELQLRLRFRRAITALRAMAQRLLP